MLLTTMRWWYDIISSSIGRKVVMALSGIAIVGFLLGHMSGNLLVFAGPDALNHYAEFLQSKPALVWGTRLTMLAALVLHMWSATTLTLDAWSARPVGYAAGQKTLETTYAARTMRWGGPLIAAYVIYHLLHLTVGAAGPRFVKGDVYANVVYGFRNPYVAGFYVLSMIAIGLHLYHGVWSFFQTMGASHERYNPLRRIAAAGVSVAIAGGFLVVPCAVLLGLVGGDLP